MPLALNISRAAIARLTYTGDVYIIIENYYAGHGRHACSGRCHEATSTSAVLSDIAYEFTTLEAQAGHSFGQRVSRRHTDAGRRCHTD